MYVYAHHILFFSPLNCHMHHVECELKSFQLRQKTKNYKSDQQ